VNVPISKLKANPKNPRVIRGDKFDKLKASLQAFPDMLNKRPLIVFTDKDGKYIVLGGNMRLKAAKELGLTELPVIVADNWTEEQKAEFLVKDNVNYGDWDHEQLANEWDEIQLAEWGLDLPVFEQAIELEAQDDEYEQQENIVTDIVLGDLFQIGEHRLLCGDATNSDDVAKLMNGQNPDLVFMDPPYGNGSSAKYGRGQIGVRTIANDKDFTVVRDFINMQISNRYLFFLQWRTFGEAIETLHKNNLRLKTIAVWDKKNAGLNDFNNNERAGFTPPPTFTSCPCNICVSATRIVCVVSAYSIPISCKPNNVGQSNNVAISCACCIKYACKRSSWFPALNIIRAFGKSARNPFKNGLHNSNSSKNFGISGFLGCLLIRDPSITSPFKTMFSTCSERAYCIAAINACLSWTPK